MHKVAAKARVRYESGNKNFERVFNLNHRSECEILIRTLKWAALAQVSIIIDSAVDQPSLEKGTYDGTSIQH